MDKSVRSDKVMSDRFGGDCRRFFPLPDVDRDEADYSILLYSFRSPWRNHLIVS
jgi:hypothetical protein